MYLFDIPFSDKITVKEPLDQQTEVMNLFMKPNRYSTTEPHKMSMPMHLFRIQKCDLSEKYSVKIPLLYVTYQLTDQ